MKKHYLLTGLALICLAASRCKTQQQPHYIVPEQYTGETRDNMISMLEHGQKLYRIHCSGCHGIYGKGRDSIPNFSKKQVENYQSAFVKQDPTNHAVANKIRPYDLDMIILFLSFRKPPATTP